MVLVSFKVNDTAAKYRKKKLVLINESRMTYGNETWGVGSLHIDKVWNRT